MSDNPYTDDEYDDTYKEVHGDEPPRDQYTEETTDDTFFPSGVGNSLSPSGWGIWPTSDPNDAARSETGDDQRAGESATGTDSGDGELWEVGLVGGLLLVGGVLFFFPEPATSAVGIGLIAIGVLVWAVEALL